jgi:hypothetical protein
MLAAKKAFHPVQGVFKLTERGHMSFAGRFALAAPGEVWDAEIGREMLSFKGTGKSTDFTPDGHRLADGLDNGNLKIFDATPLPQNVSGQNDCSHLRAE